MKKTFKRAGVAVLSMAMLLSMGAMTAISSNAAGTLKVDINSTIGVTNASTYDVYRIASSTVVGGVYSYTWETAVDDEVTGLPTISQVELYTAEDLKNLASKIALAASASGSLIPQVATGVNVGTATSSLADGYYLALVHSSDNGVMVQPVIQKIEGGNVSVVAKASPLTIDKVISSVTANEGVRYNDDKASVSSNGTVTYTLTSYIPEYSPTVNTKVIAGQLSYETPYTITDTASPSLDLQTISVTIGGDTIDSGVTATINGDKHGAVVTVSDAVVAANNGDAVVVTLTAKVNDTATLSNKTTANNLNNNVEVTYSNEYTTGKGSASDDDNVDVYTTGMGLYKYRTDTNAAMAGVTFTLTNTSTTAEYNATTDTNGYCVFKNLAEGTYTLSETPQTGFQTMSDKTVVVAAGTTNGTFKITVDGVELADANFTTSGTSYTNGKLDVGNTPGHTLPITGGMGTVLFTVGGAAIVLLAGVLFVVYMRKRKVEE